MVGDKKVFVINSDGRGGYITSDLKMSSPFRGYYITDPISDDLFWNYAKDLRVPSESEKRKYLSDIESIKEAQKAAEAQKAEEARKREEVRKVERRKWEEARRVERRKREEALRTAEARKREEILKRDEAHIKNFVESRGIKTLVHFTRIENLESIIVNGLLPRNMAHEKGVNIIISDQERYDGLLDAINMSISFPNYKMFYSKRLNDENAEWVVLCISPSVLWEIYCEFYVGNAADSDYRLNATSSGASSLAGMFRGKAINSAGNTIYRSVLKLPDYYTTDPQAEVLVHGNVGIRDIIGVCFMKEAHKECWGNRFAQQNINLKAFFFPQYFKPRFDYESWPSKLYGEGET